METLKRRLKYYGIGFGIGIVFVFVFFQNRGCSWLPGNRVKNSILDRLIVVSESTEALLKDKGLTKEDLVNVLNDGDVDFNESQKEGDNKVYVIEKDGLSFAFTLPYESFISEAFVDVKGGDVQPSSSGYGDILRFPLDENLVYPDSTQMVTCQQDILNLEDPRGILSLLKENGKIDFAKSDLSQRPKPEHYLVFTKDTLEIGARAIWYKNKLNITDFDAELVKDCE